VLAAAAAVVGSGLAPAATAATPVRAASATPAASADTKTTCTPSGVGGSTCTGTASGATAWDWYLDNQQGGMISAQPTVTVDQTTDLTNQVVHVSWTGFTPSGSLENGNDPLTGLSEGGFVQGQEYYSVFIEECRGLNPTDESQCDQYPVGVTTAGEVGNGVESYTRQGSSTKSTDCTSVPKDTVCGTGYADIQLQTAVQNSSLGCSSTQPCSLVVKPDWGGENYPLNPPAPPDCTNHDEDLSFALGSAQDNTANPCSWGNRIVVPLQFAQTPVQACSTKYAFTAQGSPMLEHVMAQWQPGWCTQSTGKVNLDYNSGVDEFAARQSFLSGSAALTATTDSALVTDPAPGSLTAASKRQFTYAPIATTAISIAYYVDNQATQEPITDLKLDARLVAKLLTESYSLGLDQCQTGQAGESDTCDPAVAGNPRSIFEDPEFYQLNPQYTVADFNSVSAGAQGAGNPMVLLGQSDMTWELTRWIISDPQARAFLEGQRDPWGMHVNTYYEKGQSYPIAQFQVLDPGYTAPEQDYGNTGYPYFNTMNVAWSPVTGLDNVAADLAGWQSSSLQFSALCTGIDTNPPCQAGAHLFNPRSPVQQFPNRALFAVVDSGTAAAFRFPSAQLVTSSGAAVGPSVDSMTAAVASMKTNPDGITQYQDFAAMPADAYPLTEVQYAMVPTCGLSGDKASAISTWLQDVAASQTYGVQPGQVPPFGGYLTLSYQQKQQTQGAAAAVQRQTCVSPPPDKTVGGTTTINNYYTGGHSGTGTGTGGGSAGVGTGLGTGGTPNSGTGAPATGKPSASASATTAQVGFGEKAADTSSLAKYVLPVALAIGGLLAIGGPLAYAFGTTGSLPLPRLRRRGAGAAPGAAAETGGESLSAAGGSAEAGAGGGEGGGVDG
jgi:hypothetical protein